MIIMLCMHMLRVLTCAVAPKSVTFKNAHFLDDDKI